MTVDLFHRVVAEPVAGEHVAAELVAAERAAAEQVAAEPVASSKYQSLVQTKTHFRLPPMPLLPPSVFSSMPSQRTCPCPDDEETVN